MKVYFFDTETGIYQGEDFEVEQVIQHENGVTTVRPPTYGKGEIPIYDPRVECWSIVSVEDVTSRRLFYKLEAGS